MDCLLRITNLHKSYGKLEVLHGIDLTVNAGEVVVIVGPSGSGKSSLLACVNFLEPFHAGAVIFDGRPVGYGPAGGEVRIRLPECDLNILRQEMGMVFQQFNLFPHLTVLQNIMEAPVHVKGIAPSMARAQAMVLLNKVGLAEKAESYPRALSGGQQQRIAIARALAMQPKLMLFDEVTSSLDPELKGEVLRVMRTLASEGMTMLVVTHELGFARDVADRIVFMENGKVIESGTPDQLLHSPKFQRTKEFLGASHDR